MLTQEQDSIIEQSFIRRFKKSAVNIVGRLDAVNHGKVCRLRHTAEVNSLIRVVLFFDITEKMAAVMGTGVKTARALFPAVILLNALPSQCKSDCF